MKHETYKQAQDMRQRIDDLEHLKSYLLSMLSPKASLVIRHESVIFAHHLIEEKVIENGAFDGSFNADDKDALLKAIDDRIAFLEQEFQKIKE